MKNVQMHDMKIMKMYGTAGLFTVMTIVILKYFKTQSQKKIYFQWESNCCCSDDFFNFRRITIKIVHSCEYSLPNFTVYII